MNMKTIKISAVALLSVLCADARPGETYTLTGTEKSITEIIEVDMKTYPNLYTGVSLNNYVSEFKKKNKIGTRKLTPGDTLVFPETKPSIEAKVVTKRNRLIEKWESESKPNMILVAEFNKNGEYTIVVKDKKISWSGVWEMEGDSIRIKNETHNLYGKEASGSKKWVTHKIILLSNEELHTQVEGQEGLKYSKIN
jgi:signal peptidase I